MQMIFFHLFPFLMFLNCFYLRFQNSLDFETFNYIVFDATPEYELRAYNSFTYYKTSYTSGTAGLMVQRFYTNKDYYIFDCRYNS